ncbi:MAG TPA: sulfite exporter TauE/SafE family protein [Bacteriovoracaceae bacterium]|nr:sulfite exporter TauE/SafE family protein [Bacteriovoracaceae bacterium]
MGSMFLLLALVTGGSLLTSLTGLGGGSLILAGLLLIYPPELAIPLHSFTQVTANGIRAGLYRKTVNWKIVFAYASLMLPFAWLGALLFDYVNPSWLKIFVGFFLLFSILPLKLHPKDEPDSKTFVLLGALSGFLGIFVGAVGPMVTPFFNRIKLGRDGVLSTKSAGQMLLQLSKIVAFFGAAGVDFVTLKDHVGLLVFGSILGVAISIPIGKRISDKTMTFFVNILLGIISVKILSEGLREIFF